MHHNQYGLSDGRPPQPSYANQQQYYSYGYPYQSYHQSDAQPVHQQHSGYGGSYQAPPGPTPPSDGEGDAPPLPPPLPPPETKPPAPGDNVDNQHQSGSDLTSVVSEACSSVNSSSTTTNTTTESATLSSHTTAESASLSSQSQTTVNSSTATAYWTTPTSTVAYWGGSSSNWPYSSWYPVGASQQTHAQQQPQTYSNSTSYNAQQYNYAQYSNAGGGSGHGWSQTSQSQGWGWGGGQQQYSQYQQNQWGAQPWTTPTQTGSETWSGGWNQHYQGSYYGQQHTPQQQQQYDGNYQGYPQGSHPPQTAQPSVDRRSRSPGTPPLQELLSPGSTCGGPANERGVPSNRKHQSSSNDGEPDSKRPRQDQCRGQDQHGGPDQHRGQDQLMIRGQDQHRGQEQRRESHDRYPPMKKVLLPNPTPSQNQVSSADQTSSHTPFPSSPTAQQTSKGGSTSDSAPNRGKFPPRFSAYVNKAFAACKTAEEREKVHVYLDVELNKIFNDNKQWSIDWDNYPLPRFLIRKSRHSSRWDTPSPSRELMTRDSPATPTMGGVVDKNDSGDDDNVLPLAFGRGRGKKKKKNKAKKGRGRFFIDNQPAFVLSAEDKAKMSLRTQRFGKQGSDGNKNISKKLSINELLKSANIVNSEDSVDAWQDHTLEGTSQSLEKQYLRLTSAPDPSTVRPLSVLKKAYDHVLSKWEETEDYHYTCEQFKSIRQDLTLQTVRNDFTVLVYETHARIALRKGDRGEFNQCQTQLKALYHEGIPGNQAEFMAYRILYLILTDNTAEISSMLKELTSDLRHSPCVDHALRVHYSWFMNNYHQFFKLYRSAPNLSGALIDMFVERERRAALKSMAKAYRPSLPVWYIAQELEFDSTEDCVAFITGLGVVLDSAHQIMDCKLTVPKLS